MREYRAKRSTLIFTLGFLGFLTVLVVFGIFFAEPKVFFVAFLAYAGWRWYQILRTPVIIRVGADDSIELQSFIQRIAVRPDRIKRIMRVARGYWMEYEGGSVSLYGNMEGIEDFLSYLGSRNPALEVKVYRWGQKGE
ncbi:MAG: hypothetical protein JSU87_02050 [Gemmatimonadota bacterium]|nr:MAG: hypothetical protein JSU87_02050 [Gemmatimonadota bacterium]